MKEENTDIQNRNVGFISPQLTRFGHLDTLRLG